MAIKEKNLPLGVSSGPGTFIRTLSSDGESQRTNFDVVKGAITDDMDAAIEAEADARELADEALQTAIDGKVDKVTGKGLSANDFTDAEKTKLSGIEAEATKTIVDAGLSDSSTNPVQNKVIADAVEPLQDAMFVVTKKSDTEPYAFRKTANGALVGTDLKEEEDTLVGGTVAWNQLCNASSVTVTSGHKYLLKKSGSYSIGSSTGSAITGLTSGSDMVIDLTQALGSTIADYIYSLEQATPGAGVAWFKKLFPKPYYAYDSGSLQSVQGVSAHVTRGFNQWDEVWEIGNIVPSTGAEGSSTNVIRAKNHIPCLPNTVYYFKNGSSAPMNICFYDSDKGFISGINSASSNQTRTTPEGCFYIRFSVGSAYGTTYNNDICINLSKTTGTPKNGDYVAYDAHTYALDSDIVLRGIPKLDANNNLYYDGDTYESDGTVTRKYGVVDLGTLAWSISSSLNCLYANLPLMKVGASIGEIGSAICPLYTTVGSVSGITNFVNTYGDANKVLALTTVDANRRIFVRDTSYTDAATFKTAMSGVYLVYELATSTTETADPYTTPQECDADGTEEYVTTGIVPVGHDTDYIIESAKLPDVPTTDGTYTLKATVASGIPSFGWSST